MHRYFPILCLAVAGTLIACKKEAAPTVPSAEGEHASGTTAPATSEPLASAPTAPIAEPPAGETVTDSKLADLGAAPVNEPAPDEGEPKVAAAAESSTTPEEPAKEDAAKSDGEEPKASDEKSKASSEKKKGDKDAKDKAAEPPKEVKPKFTELGVEVTKPGSGTAATAGKRVVLHYRASLVDAAKPFDSTYALHRPIEVELGANAKLQVIEGLRRGLEGLKPGSEARLQIPASLAWAEKGAPGAGVPPNADVIFEVQVLDVQ